ncbi:MAG: dihydroorotate dehydrogenase-like protein [Anaerolineaceae bacterium]|nr:dihydroorotate dehydrogenase-like protein [Anaerolineaceae bacterium]
MVDLRTNYLGLQLRNPLIASASPLSKKADTVRQLEDAGVSAIVMYSLFEEQIQNEARALDHYLTRGSESFAEALSYFPDLGNYNVGPKGYLDQIHELKSSVDIPIIGSLNGISEGGWIEYAKLIQQAGADALELNIYYLPTDPTLTSQELEKSYVELVKKVKSSLRIPLAVKLSPYFSALPNFAKQLVEAGADGLVLFNRFYQPDLDVEEMVVKPDLNFSNSSHLRLPLRWTAIMYDRIKTDFAISGGIHSATDLVKAVMAGANVGAVAAVLIERGPQYAATILQQFERWLSDHEYDSVSMMLGAMSQKAVAEPAAFERANYMKILQSLDDSIL